MDSERTNYYFASMQYQILYLRNVSKWMLTDKCSSQLCHGGGQTDELCYIKVEDIMKYSFLIDFDFHAKLQSFFFDLIPKEFSLKDEYWLKQRPKTEALNQSPDGAGP